MWSASSEASGNLDIPVSPITETNQHQCGFRCSVAKRTSYKTTNNILIANGIFYIKACLRFRTTRSNTLRRGQLNHHLELMYGS